MRCTAVYIETYKHAYKADMKTHHMHTYRNTGRHAHRHTKQIYTHSHISKHPDRFLWVLPFLKEILIEAQRSHQVGVKPGSLSQLCGF